MPDAADRVRRFRELHESGCFVIPNPWDIGSARLLTGLGFLALASTSSGFAWSEGRRDAQSFLEQTLAHFQTLAESVPVPVNGDFRGGFATEPEGVGANVALAVRTGIAGISIEDSTGDPKRPLFDFRLAVERIRAARRAIDESGTGVLFTGRSEGFIPVFRISTRPSGAWSRTRKRAPSASTRPGSGPGRKSLRWSRRSLPVP
jgi:2-methylisocitrate lyase-like PEP mutase family enzyme